jgi:hypothetical protein
MTMDIYSHVLPTMQQEAMDKLHQAFMDNDEDDNGMAGGALARKK